MFLTETPMEEKSKQFFSSRNLMSHSQMSTDSSSDEKDNTTLPLLTIKKEKELNRLTIFQNSDSVD